MDNVTSLNDITECEEHPPLFLGFKLILVGVIGTILAIIGFLENTLAFYTFVSSRALRNKNLLYLTCISACDIFICFSYVEIMSIQVYAEYFHYFPLFRLWHNYLRVAFAISHIAICTVSFLLMKILRVFCRHRGKIVIMAFLFGVFFRGTIYFEIQIYHLEECDGFASMGVKISELARNVYYDGIWRFWTRRIATVFLPFFVLLYCNAAIVVSSRKNNRENTIKMLILYCIFGNSMASSKVRNDVKAATRSLIMVVTCYLCANIIDVFIAAWEYLDDESLSQLEEFYSVATDVSSLLTILAANLRFPIYLINDKIVLREVRFTISLFYYHLAICFTVLSKRSGRKCSLKDDLKQQSNNQKKTVTHDSTNNYIPRKTRNSGFMFISVTGVSLDRQRSQHSAVTFQTIPPLIALRIPLATEEQSSSEVNDNHLSLSSSSSFNETEKDSLLMSK